MIFNKKIGRWCNSSLVTKLDDIAYQILINNFYDEESCKNFISQSEVMYEQSMNNSFYNEYFKANILLRKEKINRLNEIR